MSRPRIWIPAGRWENRITLQQAERRHLVEVLRLTPGDPVEVFDGAGSISHASLACEGKQWFLNLGEREVRIERRPSTRLAVALLKGTKLDLVVRMATEVGTASIEPFVSARSVPRPKPGSLAERERRWTAIAREAARQSGRASLPRIEPCRTFHEVLTSQSEVRILLHERARAPVIDTLFQARTEAERLVLIGPEGGFTGGEVEKAEEAGFTIVGLGLPVMRAETAAVVACALACLDRRSAVE